MNDFCENIMSDEDIRKLDALGNPLVIGAKYGYSRSSNGIKEISIGNLMKINKTSVRLNILESERFYSLEQRGKNIDNRTVNVGSHRLFPIREPKRTVSASDNLFCEHCGNVPWEN